MQSLDANRRAIVKEHGRIAALHRQVSGKSEELRDRKIERTSQLEEFSELGIHIERDALISARGDIESAVGHCRVVNETVIFLGSHVEEHTQIGCGNLDSVDTHKGSTFSSTRDAHPLTSSVQLIGEEDETEFEICKIEPECLIAAIIQTSKCGNILRTDSELVRSDRRCIIKDHITAILENRKVSLYI